MGDTLINIGLIMTAIGSAVLIIGAVLMAIGVNL